jgi:hypothetical protein
LIAPSIEGLEADGRLLIAVPLLADVEAPKDAADALSHLRATVRHDPGRLADALTMALSVGAKS